MNLLDALCVKGLSTYHGTSSAFNGLSFELYKAFYGRDDQYMKARYEYWKETAELEKE
jgi:hypothetical protein